MERWIHEHPYLSGTLVLLAIVLFILYRRLSAPAASVGTAGPSDSLQAAGLAAGVQLQTAQLGASLGIAQLNAQVNEAQLLAASQDTQAQLAANVQLQNILSSADVANRQTQASLTLGLAQTGQAPLVQSGGSGRNGTGTGGNSLVLPSSGSSGSIPSSFDYNVSTDTGASVSLATKYGFEDCTSMQLTGGGLACVARNIARLAAGTGTGPGVNPSGTPNTAATSVLTNPTIVNPVLSGGLPTPFYAPAGALGGQFAPFNPIIVYGGQG
jgi:hypothetical protein